jgi:hypothetical protein
VTGKRKNEDPLKALNQTSVLGGALALGFTSLRYKGAPAAIAQSLGERLREVLPEGYAVEVNGPALDVKRTRGGSAAGMWGMLLLERGTRVEKLTRVYADAAESLRHLVTAPHRERFPRSGSDPHVAVSDTAIEVWWGADDPADAAVRLRPIPRSEIGV